MKRTMLVMMFFGSLGLGQNAKLTDFTEVRYNEHRLLLGSCVDRSYTFEMSDRVVVLRQRTCRPEVIREHPAFIGQMMTLVNGKPGKIGIVDAAKGKPLWLPVVKITDKAPFHR